MFSELSYNTLSEIRGAAGASVARWHQAKREAAEMHALGADPAACAALLNTARRRRRVELDVLRAAQRRLLAQKYPTTSQGRATTVTVKVRSYKVAYPKEYRQYRSRVMWAKDWLVEGRITLDSWREYDAALHTHWKLTCKALARGEALPDVPVAPIPRPVDTSA